MTTVTPEASKVSTTGTQRHYHQRRAHGDRHPAVLRHLFNRMLGQLHHCLQAGQTYNPAHAFPEHTHHDIPAAA